MEQKQKDALWAQYSKQTHVLGRILSILTVALLLGAPFVIGGLLGAYPDLGATARGFLSVGLVWTVSSVAEFLIYTPMLGAGGSYLSFVTGNISNLKLPCALDAMERAGVKSNSEEGEIISTIAIAVSSIVTTLIIIVGVVLIVPLTPLLSSPVLAPAFSQLLPALFGGLAVVFISKNVRLSIAPVILMLVLFIFVPALNASTVGIMVPVGVVFSLVVARILYKKGLV